MSITLVKNAYRSLVPETIREKIWAVRHSRRRTSNHAASQLPATAPVPACDVCKSGLIERFNNGFVTQLSYMFYHCMDCDFIFVHPKPVPESVYTDAPVEVAFGSEHWNRHYLDSIEKYRADKGKLLEIGFGDGSFLKMAHDSGWNVHGLDLSKACADHAANKLALPNIQIATVEEANYPDNYFDVVCAYNFIEHVPDLRATLSDLRRILKPDGLLVLLCPNIGGLYHNLVPQLFGATKDPLAITWVPPYHVSYFKKSNFALLMKNTGFSILGDESFGSNLLWLQHEATYGKAVTDAELEKLLAEIRESPLEKGTDRERHFNWKITELMRKRIIGAMTSAVMPLEREVGSESGILLIAKKHEGSET